jgi:hypothetical protein
VLYRDGIRIDAFEAADVDGGHAIAVGMRALTKSAVTSDYLRTPSIINIIIAIPLVAMAAIQYNDPARVDRGFDAGPARPCRACARIFGAADCAGGTTSLRPQVRQGA